MNKWNSYFLGNLGEITSSKRIFQREYVEAGLPFYRTKEIKELANKEKVTSELFISRSRYEEIKREFGVPSVGDLLITAIGTIGEVYIVDDEHEFYFKDGNILWLKEFRNVNPYFLKYLLFSLIDDLNNLSSGSTYKALPIAKLKQYKILLPPLEEQKRIAEILDKADRIRRKRQEAIRLTEELGRSIFLDMFGDPVANPKGWEIKKLSTTFSKPPQIGIIKPAHADGDHPVIRVGEIGNREVELKKCGRVTLSEQETEKFRCNSGDILLARAIGSESHLGKASMLQETNQIIVFDSHVMRLRFDSDIMLPNFFLQWLTTQGGRHLFMKKAGRTAVQFNVNGKQISSIDIPIPLIHKQREFSLIYSKLINSLSKSEHIQELSNNLFNSLLQRAFRGEL